MVEKIFTNLEILINGKYTSIDNTKIYKMVLVNIFYQKQVGKIFQKGNHKLLMKNIGKLKLNVLIIQLI